MLTVDFAEDDTAAIRGWLAAHPGVTLALTFNGEVLGIVGASPQLLRGSVAVSGSTLAALRRAIEAATKPSHFGPHGSA